MFTKRDASGPTPIEIGGSQFWLGNDGLWSTFALQVGTQPQTVQTVISTSSSSSWVMDGASACPPGIPIPDCQTARGTLFNKNQSLTWVPYSNFDMKLEVSLGYDTTAFYGYDTVALNWPGSGGPSLDHQVVGITASNNYLLGGFGLNPRPVNFTTFNNPQVSFMQSLQNVNQIPSLSWSYTAGAHYRFNQVLGSLVLGGYDASLRQTSLEFNMDADISRDLTVAVHSITSGAYASLLPEPVYAFIDSTLPFIWLPQDACTAFEKAFGLVWNSTYSLYLVSESQHASLKKQNPNITFTLSSPKIPTSSLDITLPYAAFDLNASWPLVGQGMTSRYFPLKRAANQTQYTLGRTFLQEAIVTADYGRNTFNVAQRKWDPNASAQLVAISPPSSSKALSTGAIVGIVISAVAVFGLLSLTAFLLWSRRRRRRRQQHSQQEDKDTSADEKTETPAVATLQERRDLKTRPSPIDTSSSGLSSSSSRDIEKATVSSTASSPIATTAVMSPTTVMSPSIRGHSPSEDVRTFVWPLPIAEADSQARHEADSRGVYELPAAPKPVEVHGSSRPQTPMAELEADAGVSRAWFAAVSSPTSADGAVDGLREKRAPHSPTP